MKKGLLSILAGALLVVGCQNYDDQFDALESQINALASTVAGLSQVQNDLSSLASQVSAIQGSIDSSVQTALADGLADIDTAIETLNAAAEAAANNSDIAQISENVEEVQTSLAELLAQSSVFQGDVVVNTVATLEAYHAMGDGLAIVNGFVKITVDDAMDIAKVQELVNFIKVTTEDFAYTAGKGVETEVTFSNLAGTRSLTLDQEGGYMLENLESATVISLDDDSSVDVVHLGSLISATSLSDGTGAGTFTFSKATELHLTSLPRSPSAALNLGVDEGGVIDISALTDKTVAGKDTALDLTISGPSSLTISGLSGNKTGSDIIASEIANLTINGYDGKITIGQDVANFTADNITDIDITGDDLVTFTGTGALNPNVTDDKAGPALTLDADNDLETVTLDGTYTTVTLSNNGNLTSVTLGGTVTGSGGVSILSNSDLTTINVTNLTTDYIKVDGNSDIEELTIDATTAAGEATTQKGTVIVNNNESMTSLNISTNNVDILTISNNADLETIDLTGMTSIGATGKASTTIRDNRLEASVADDENDSFTSESGMSSAKEYLTAVAADADSKAMVTFDNVDSALDKDGDETSDVADYVVLALTPKVITTAGKDETKHKVAYGIVLDNTPKFGLWANDATNRSAGHAILVDGTDTAVTSLTLSANPTLAIAEIKRSMALTRATAYGLTLDAYEGWNPTGKITVQASTDSSTADVYVDLATSNKTTASAADVIKLTINGKSVTTTVGTGTQFGGAKAQLAQWIAFKAASAWVGSYGAGKTSGTESLFDITTTTSGNNGVINIAVKSSRSGRRGYDKTYSLELIRKETNTATPSFGAYYGATTADSDNNTISNGIIVTIESNAGGTILDDAKGASWTSNRSIEGAGSVADVIKLTSTLKVNSDPQVATSTVNDIFEDQARGDGALGAGGDAVLPEGNVTEVATAATTTDRTAWL